MNSRLAVSVIGLVAAIGAVAAVYVSRGPDGNVSAVRPAAETSAPAAPAAPVAPTAPKTGRLAAFVVHKTPEPLAEIAFASADGTQRSLGDWRGRVVLLNFWATWCAPCRHEMPTLDNLQAKLGGDDFEVVALSLDRGGFDKPKVFFADIGVKDLKLYNDASGKSGRTLRAVGMPTTLLIGRDGAEIGRIAGPAEWDSEEALALIRAALGTS